MAFIAAMDNQKIPLINSHSTNLFKRQALSSDFKPVTVCVYFKRLFTDNVVIIPDCLNRYDVMEEKLIGRQG